MVKLIQKGIRGIECMKNRVKELREQKNISQICLATHVGCSQNTISKIELGTAEPKAGLLLELSKYFNVSIDYILYNSAYKYVQETYYNIRKVENKNLECLKIFSNLTNSNKELVEILIRKLSENEKGNV